MVAIKILRAKEEEEEENEDYVLCFVVQLFRCVYLKTNSYLILLSGIYIFHEHLA